MTGPILALVVLVAILVVAWAAHTALMAAHGGQSGGGAGGHRWQHAVLAAMGGTFRLLLKAGIPLGPMALLTVRGRKSGEPRTIPVDLFVAGERRWLVATHQGNAAWVLNLRAAGEGSYRRGRQTNHFSAVEVPPADAAGVLALAVGPRLARRVGGLVLRRTLGATSSPTPDEFAQIARAHPVFELSLVAEPAVAPPGAGDESAPREVNWLATRLGPILIVLGLAVAAVHLALLGTGGLTLGQAASGAVLGLLVAGGGNHLRLHAGGLPAEEA